MDNESKKPCAPVEEESRDTTTVFREEDPLCAALDEFCYALNFWYGSMNNPWQREDRTYRKKLAQPLYKRSRSCTRISPRQTENLLGNPGKRSSLIG